MLVVDDSPVIRDLLTEALTKEGHEVLLAASGTYSYNGTYFNQPVGALYVIQGDITSLRTWSWSDFAIHS